MTSLLCLVASADRRHLRPALVPGLLQDRRDVGIGGEALPAVQIPVEDHPDAVGLVGVAEHERALRAVLLALLSTLGGEDIRKAVEVLDRSGCQEHPGPPLRFPASPNDAEAGASMCPGALDGHRALASWMGGLP